MSKTTLKWKKIWQNEVFKIENMLFWFVYYWNTFLAKIDTKHKYHVWRFNKKIKSKIHQHSVTSHG